MTLEEEIRTWAAPLLAGAGMDLIALEYVREGKEWFLRFFIDKPGGISLDDCELASNKLSEELDLRDPVPQGFRLEVSSPGLERPLRGESEWREQTGRLVRVSTYAPVQGKRIVTARLIGVEEEELLLQEGAVKIRIPFKQIAKVNLAVEF